MALVDTRFNSYQPNLTVLASNNVIKLGSVVSIVVRSIQSPGKVSVPVTSKSIVGVNSFTPTNFGSTTTVSVYVNSQRQAQASNVTYKTFSVVETFVNTIEDTQKYATFNPQVTTRVRTESTKVAVYVRPVVVEESNRIFGYRIPYRNNDKLVAASDRNFSTDRKATNIAERYVFVQDSKNRDIQSQIRFDNNLIKSIEVQNRTGTKRVTMNEQRRAVSVHARREPFSNETRIRPVNVIDDSIAGSGGGGGGAGGGAGVLTEYWS